MPHASVGTDDMAAKNAAQAQSRLSRCLIQDIHLEFDSQACSVWTASDIDCGIVLHCRLKRARAANPSTDQPHASGTPNSILSLRRASYMAHPFDISIQ